MIAASQGDGPCRRSLQQSTRHAEMGALGEQLLTAALLTVLRSPGVTPDSQGPLAVWWLMSVQPSL